MATISVLALGGLDQKSNDLTRATDKASEMQNVEYDTQSTVKKRTGYAEFLTNSHVDQIYYQEKDEHLLFNNNSDQVTVVNSSTGATKTLTMPFTIGTADISFTENQQNLYFTSTDLSIPVLKYDGSNIYRAGLPAPRTTSGTTETKPTYSTSSTSGYTRIFYGYKDINGNLTYSPYVQYSNLSTDVTIGTFKNNASFLQSGYFDKYCILSSTSGGYLSTYATISSSSRTITVKRHNYVAGEKFLMDTENFSVKFSSSKTYLVLDIESVNTSSGTNITFTAASIGSETITIRNLFASAGTEQPLDVRSRFYVATSTSSDYGYTVANPYLLDNSLSDQTTNLINPQEWTYEGRLLTTPPAFEDIYDSTTLKIMPPYCKFMGSYGSQIIYGNVGKFFNDDNTSSNYDNGDLVIFSDLSSGDGPENVSPLNFQKIGETYEADITGLRRCNDSFVVLKRNGVFTIDGALLPSQYQLRKLNTNYVGCTSHKSILATDDGLFFQGHNGIYYTNGIGVKKISFELDNYFGSKNYNLTRSVRYKEKQKALFYINGTGLTNQKIVVVDYYYNQVYFWTNIQASNGFVEDKNGNVFFSNGAKIFKFDSTIYNDNGSSIDAYYSTTYHHCGMPSLRKKFVSMRIFALTNDVFDLDIYHDADWKYDSSQNKHTLSFGSNDQTKLLVHDMQTCRAQRYTFRNNIVNQPMVLTGYEVHWEQQQTNDKD